MLTKTAADIDKGYAWVVLLASFSIEVNIGILFSSVSVLTPAMLKEVDGDIAEVSFVGSSLLGFFSIFGPIAGVIHDKIDHRLTCMVGGVLILIGMVSASFCKTVTGLLISYGIVTGIGYSLAANVSGVAPASYFVKKVMFAYGVTLSGDAVGLFIGGPFCAMLLEKYSLSGTLLILGAVGFNVVLAGAAIRPQGNFRERGHLNIELKFQELSGKCDLEEADLHDGGKESPSSELRHGSSLENICHIDRTTDSEYESFSSVNERRKGIGFTINSEDNSDKTTNESLLHDELTNDISVIELRTSIGTIKPENSDKTMPDNSDKTTNEPLLHDVLTNDNQHPKKRKRGVFQRGISILLKNGFVLYGISCLLWGLGDSIVFVHLLNYAETHGSSPIQAANLMVGMGIAGLFGGLLAGFASSDSTIGCLLLHVGVVGFAGVATVLFPFYSYTHSLQMLYGSLYGFYNQAATIIISPLVIELVGFENLAVAYGLCFLFFGVGYLTGGPAAGRLYDVTQDYNNSFYLAGAVMLGSAIVAMVIPLFKKNRATRPTGSACKTVSTS